MHRRMPVVLFALVATFACSIGCARKPDDAKISSDIESKYAQDSGLSTKQLSVQTSGGVVTISGYVDNEAQRAAAARQAASADGVKEVVNNLQVGIASNASAKAALPSKVMVTNAAASKADRIHRPSENRIILVPPKTRLWRTTQLPQATVELRMVLRNWSQLHRISQPPTPLLRTHLPPHRRPSQQHLRNLSK